MTHAHITGISMLRTGRWLDRSVRDMAEEVCRNALSEAGVGTDAVQAVWFSNTRQALMEGQNSIRGQVALRDVGLGAAAISNVENACASSSTGLWNAINAIRSGACDVALVVGSEKMIYPDVDKETMFQTFMGGTDIHRIDEARTLFRRIGGEPDDGASSDAGTHTFFMDMYAALARQHMRRFGTTERQIATAAAKNHGHSTMNPLSQYTHAMSVDDVLADKAIAFPLTRSMCAPVSDGAAAAVVVSDDWLNRNARPNAVAVRACILRAGLPNRDPEDYDAHVGARTAVAAYEAAGLGPQDIDVAEVHDATAFGEILQIENLGIAARGDGGLATERGDTTLGGRCPVNPSGGLVSKGHPIAATGMIQLHELVTQLRGEAGPRQVPGARIGIAENGGGLVGVEDAACVVTILEAA
ncbi:MAG: thiolase family protein [Boseongicola sp. SB0664_bin_43]|uniref:propanoyl-CoA C-acyltransferase n=1 Tax=Boseongicola sp. SB0664_bin_43 TaxID=2604844 RepID=A0A6B0XZB9_9RHOB|nr:thiolase family protein [Boseongicola sp. SB0664_bin_43]MYK31810.1 thiolase family protein [Boseongicola sp. SB0670_bin_30]